MYLLFNLIWSLSATKSVIMYNNIEVVISTEFQTVSRYVFEQSVVFYKATVQNIYKVFYFKTSSMYIFNVVKKQSGIGIIVNALFGNFAYLHNLYSVVELHTNFVLKHLESQPAYIIKLPSLSPSIR